MTRKDYIILAEALRVQFRDSTNHPSPMSTEGDGVFIAACALADSLQRDNSRFNREHFLAVVRGEKELHSRPSRNGVRA
jgi:hypothetical protein